MMCVRAPRFRVLVYAPDGRTGWTLCATSASEEAAAVEALEYRRHRLLAAVVSVSPDPVPRLEVLEANVPHPARLLNSPEFRLVATAL